jgi:hypothetical protein
MTREKAFRQAAQRARPELNERQSKLALAALGKEGDSKAVAFVALKYFRPDTECFSQWTPDELRAFSEFNRKVSAQTWQQIMASGGKGSNKAGLGYTPHDGSSLPDIDFFRQHLSEDITWVELRVTQKARVHGFRVSHAFFLVYLDRNHRLLN